MKPTFFQHFMAGFYGYMLFGIFWAAAWAYFVGGSFLGVVLVMIGIRLIEKFIAWKAGK